MWAPASLAGHPWGVLCDICGVGLPEVTIGERSASNDDFTDAAIRALAERREGLVFLLWGAAAGRKAGGGKRKPKRQQPQRQP